MKIVVLCWLLSWSLWIVSVPCNLRNCSAWWVSIRLGCLVGWSQENPTFTRVCIPPLSLLYRSQGGRFWKRYLCSRDQNIAYIYPAAKPKPKMKRKFTFLICKAWGQNHLHHMFHIFSIANEIWLNRRKYFLFCSQWCGRECKCLV